MEGRWLCIDSGVRGRADAGGHSNAGGDDSGWEQTDGGEGVEKTLGLGYIFKRSQWE